MSSVMVAALNSNRSTLFSNLCSWEEEHDLKITSLLLLMGRVLSMVLAVQSSGLCGGISGAIKLASQMQKSTLSCQRWLPKHPRWLYFERPNQITRVVPQ